MLKSFGKFLKYLEQWEKYEPSSFWLSSIALYICFSAVFGALSHVSEFPYESQAVIVELRAGGPNEKVGIVRKVAAFFLSKSNPSQRPQPKCPGPKYGPIFLPGSGSNSPWGQSDPDPCQKAAVPPRNQWNSDKEFYRYDDNQDKDKEKKNQTPIKGECRPRIIKSRINEDPGLIRAAKAACKNKQVQADINAMEEQIRGGNMNPGIGSKKIGDGITEFRGENGGRILARENKQGVVEILGKSGKKKKNQDYVIAQVKKVFPKPKNPKTKKGN